MFSPPPPGSLPSPGQVEGPTPNSCLHGSSQPSSSQWGQGPQSHSPTMDKSHEGSREMLQTIHLPWKVDIGGRDMGWGLLSPTPHTMGIKGSTMAPHSCLSLCSSYHGWAVVWRPPPPSDQRRVRDSDVGSSVERESLHLPWAEGLGRDIGRWLLLALIPPQVGRADSPVLSVFGVKRRDGGPLITTPLKCSIFQ